MLSPDQMNRSFKKRQQFYFVGGVFLVLIAYFYGRTGFRDVPMVNKLTRSGHAQDAIYGSSTLIKTTRLNSQAYLVIGNLALPIPTDHTSNEIAMLPALGLNEECALDGKRECSILLLSRSLAQPEPANYYAPVTVDVIDLMGLSVDDWMKLEGTVDRYAILPSKDAVKMNDYGISIKRIETDLQMGQGYYLLLTDSNASTGALVFVRNEEIAKRIVDGARKI